jgi:hypothetical protein
MLSVNSYLFRHRCAILREFNNNKWSQAQHVILLLITSFSLSKIKIKDIYFPRVKHTAWPLEIGLTGCPETSAITPPYPTQLPITAKYPYTSRRKPEMTNTFCSFYHKMNLDCWRHIFTWIRINILHPESAWRWHNDCDSSTALLTWLSGDR